MIINGPINDLGYGQVCASISHTIEQLDPNKHFLSIIGNPGISDDDIRCHSLQKMTDLSRFKKKDSCLKIWHEFDLFSYPGSGYYMAMPFFEICTLDQKRIASIKATDMILAPTKWAKDVILHHIPNHPVSVVNIGVDRKIFYDLPYQQTEKYVFFTCGKWEVRKGHDLIIEAFVRAFSNKKNVELWMMCHNPFLTPEEERYWNSLASHPMIKVLPRVRTQAELANIMRKTSCGVFPSRAEGWNMELLEMMSCGKPVIASNYSAHTEYCTEENSTLLSVEDLIPAVDNKWFFGESLWADINVEELISAMRDMYNKRVINNEKGIETTKRLSWESCAKNIIRLANDELD